MTNASELLPCPFCGHPPVKRQIKNDGRWLIDCNTVTCIRPRTELTRTEAEAIAAWNTRQVTQLEAQLAEMREALAKFQAHVIRHACVWDDAENGSHHHPIWAEVANLLTQSKEPK